MPNKMLIDASHPEETRVVVTRGNRIEEFDFESQDKKQLKGNIYLARITRVEPSLQAAFVEYGGNRHGFLAFSEIHPDYYQIPVADRQALLRADAEAAEAEEEDDEAEERGNRGRRRGRSGKNRRHSGDHGRGDQRNEAAADEGAGEPAEPQDDAPGGEASDDAEDNGVTLAARTDADVISERVPHGDDDNGGQDEGSGGASAEDEVESVGAEDALEEVPSRRRQPRRQYKIQEVMKRRQILLVQVVKEERGNKGAALTTYLSLAGRYSVLMPNTARGGGISRKITSAPDRKRLKEVVSDLDVPDGMGVILRTAGANRTKAEIKRDYEYLMRLWENVRNLTLASTAPALVYEEGSLIKRSVRDLYNKDISEIQVAGDEGYREAKDFMRMLMPSHAKMVQPYRDNVPIFARNGIEAQLDRMLQPQVTLKSGGYIIINQTEALVSIDVNSGRSTKEHSIEDTALQTNLEAAEEVARQLRLRDLAGLIVIDFIDMEENRNNRSVEKRLKDHLKHDRARIQVGRISHFGLLEMSRQRIRASVLESTMKPCPHCGGAGHVRSDSSVALHVVRAIEEFLLKDNRSHITVRTTPATALYVLNHKRSTLVDMEKRFGVLITMETDDTVGAQHCVITRGLAVDNPIPIEQIVQIPEVEEEPDLPVEEEEAEEAEETSEVQPRERAAQAHDGDGSHDRKRRRRRRRRGGRDREAGVEGERVHTAVATGIDDDAGSAAAEEDEPVADSADSGVRAEDAGDAERKKRRRGKRGGKRNRKDETAAEGEAETGEAEAMGVGSPETPESPAEAETISEAIAAEPAPAEQPVAEKPKRARRAPKRAASAAVESVTAGDDMVAAAPAEAAPETPAPVEEEKAAKPRASRRKSAPAETPEPARPVVVSTGPEPAEPEEAAKPRKAGWWQRKSFF